MTLTGFGSGNAAAYRYSAANLNSIVTLPGVSFIGDTTTQTFPGQSITLFDVPAGGVVPTLAPTTAPTSTPIPTATNTPAPTPTPDPFASVTSLANGQILRAGTANGTFGDTHTNNALWQTITERESGGNPGNRYSYMENVWTFDLTASNPDALTLHANAWGVSGR